MSSDLSRQLSHGKDVLQHPLDPEERITFPQLTQGGPETDAYLEETGTGLVSAQEAESGLPQDELEKTLSRQASSHTLHHHKGDLEKAGKGDDFHPEDDDAKLVTFVHQDPENPRNFSKTRKWLATLSATLLCFNSGYASSVITGGLTPMAERFHCSEEVMNMSVALFVVGFGVGPLILAPLSEIYGRRIIYLVSMFLFIVFTVPSAVAKDVAVNVVFRFFAGCGASSPMTNAAGTIADVWDVRERGNKMAIFSTVLFAAPCLGPPIGGYIAMYTDWRWIYYHLIMFSGVAWVFAFFFLEETYAPFILTQRAKKMRKETGDKNIMTEQERRRKPFGEILTEALLRPVIMLCTEPIMMLFSAYLCLVYGLLYGFFFAIPIVFGEGHGFSLGQTGLIFFAVFVGVCSSSIIVCPIQDKAYLKRCDASPTGKTVPESRLLMMMPCSLVLPAGLFIFAWTSMPHVSWVGPMIACLPIGFALVGIYVAANAYLVDAFSQYSASAMAAKTFIRSITGASVPMWIGYMYHRLHNQWAGTLMAFISLGMAPIPFVFYFYGKKIRATSKMASK